MDRIPNETSGEFNDEYREKIESFIRYTVEVTKPAQRSIEESSTQESAIREFESREYQLAAWEALWRARESGKDRGLIHLATGLGKTSVAVFDYAKFREERAQSDLPARGLFVVHQNNILEQASERFAQVLPQLRQSYYESGQQDTSADLTFATFQSLTRNIAHIPSDSYDYIIYDEAHHIEAKTYKKVVDHFTPSFQLGLTATPQRMDDKNIMSHFGEALYSKSLPEALAEHHLASLNYQPMYDNAVLELVQGGFNEEKLMQLKQLLEVEPRNEEIKERIIASQDSIRERDSIETVKTIIFCTDVEHADAMAQLMDGESYHSMKDWRKQEDILSRFRKDGLETITVRDMFNEGVDIPDARLIVFLRTTQSPTIYEQQLGRGLRKTATKSEVNVLDFVANIERLDMVYTLANNVKRVRAKSDGEDGDQSKGGEGVGSAFEPLNLDDAEFIFNPHMVKFLEHYHYLLERRNFDWSNFSDREIIDLALQLSPSKPLTQIDIDSLGNDVFPSVNHIRQRFGSTRRFQKECGFDIVLWEDFSDEEIIEMVHRLSPDKAISRPMLTRYSQENQLPGIALIIKRFGSWKNFVEKCGYEYKEYTDWDNYSNDDLVLLAKELSPNDPMTSRAVVAFNKEGSFPSLGVIAKRFGSLVAFQQACGFEVTVRTDFTSFSNSEIIELAKQLSPNAPLSQSNLKELSRDGLFPSAGTIAKRFGSVVAFQNECGFTVRNWGEYSDDDLVELAKKLSPTAPLGVKDISELSRSGEFPSMIVIAKRFGNIKAFQAKCGFDVKDWRQYSNEQLIELAHAISPGAPLTRSIHRQLSIEKKFPSVDTIKERFGSINAFHKACGYSSKIQP